MKITYDEQKHLFSLSNRNISYIFSVEKSRYLMYRYFGRRLRTFEGSNRPCFFDRGFCSNPLPEEKRFSLDTLPRDYDMLTMTGGHMDEKNINRRPLTSDSIVAESIRGSSSPQATPCIVLMDKEERYGE